jgi:threonine aldolase
MLWWSKQDPKFGKLFDTISVCLFVKGLGAIGSVLLADKATIHRCLKNTKNFRGGMRQVGYLAAAGIYALDNNGTSCREIIEERKNWLMC